MICPDNNRLIGTTSQQRGLSLVETILAAMVAAMMMISLVYLLKSSSDDLRAKRNADSLQQFAQMAGQYLDANRAGIIQALTDPGDATAAALYCKLNASTTDGSGGTVAYQFQKISSTNWKAVCATDANWLIWKNFLPSGYALTNPYGQKWIVIYRLVYAKYDGANMTTQGDIEMLVVATGGIATPNAELGITTQLLGGVGGMYPDTTNAPVASCPSGKVCGSGGWQTDLSNFTF